MGFQMNSKRLRSGAIYLLLLLALGAFLYTTFERRPSSTIETVPIADVGEEVRNGNVDSISTKDHKVQVKRRNGEEVQSRIEDGSAIIETLTNLGVTPLR